jgi:predicted phosphodiesterase
MRAAIISDIHGNRHAFEAVLAEIADDGPDELWCLGDLVGYGADPDACVELARENALDEFSRGAGLAARWTQEVMTRENIAFLEGLAPQDLRQPVGLYHASPRDPIWEYVLSALLAELCLDQQEHRICLIGHSHVALSFARPHGKPATGEPRRAGSELDLSEGEWLLNPGSVGQPRDGDPRAAWMLLDLDRLKASYRRTEYDIPGAAAAIRAAGLPDSLAERLEYGQ